MLPVLLVPNGCCLVLDSQHKIIFVNLALDFSCLMFLSGQFCNCVSSGYKNRGIQKNGFHNLVKVEEVINFSWTVPELFVLPSTVGEVLIQTVHPLIFFSSLSVEFWELYALHWFVYQRVLEGKCIEGSLSGYQSSVGMVREIVEIYLHTLVFSIMRYQWVCRYMKWKG